MAATSLWRPLLSSPMSGRHRQVRLCIYIYIYIYMYILILCIRRTDRLCERHEEGWRENGGEENRRDKKWHFQCISGIRIYKFNLFIFYQKLFLFILFKNKSIFKALYCKHQIQP